MIHIYERPHENNAHLPEEAARAYDSYVIANNLPNPLNFPEEETK